MAVKTTPARRNGVAMNSERVAVVDLPIPELGAKEMALGQRLLARAEFIYVDERDVLKALPAYVKAAESGNIDAFKAIDTILYEEGDTSVQAEMLQALQSVFVPHKATEKDIEFVKGHSSSKIGELPESDVRKLLHIAQYYYHVLEDCVAGTMECKRNLDDAINDDTWIFPDGHDDGEASDTMWCDN